MADWFNLGISFPITDPTWIFFLVLAIILLAPIVLGRLNIPHIIGMIIAGVLIGEHGLNIMSRDSSFELFGNVGLYYIMFLAGLEMNMENFRAIRGKAIILGILGFVVPMVLGYFANAWILHYAAIPSVLIACMYASHTLVSYPIVNRYGISRHRSVGVSVGATAITDSLTLFVLAIVGGQFKGEDAGSLSWLWLIVRVAVLGGFVVFSFPRIGRWFFRKYSNGVVQFIFVLAMMFLSAGLMKLVGMEGILGAFLAGLVMNRLIPHVSPLMHNIEFVGNALFVPYFLIGVGMLIDVRVFFGGLDVLEVVGVMIAMSLLTKWLTAYATQKLCRMTSAERSLIFGLTTARAAATLAVVLVGYNIILPDGSHLLGSEVLNGAIALILVTCVVSSFATERASRRLALEEGDVGKENPADEKENILITVSDPETVEHLMGLALVIRDPKQKDNLVALNVIIDDGAARRKARDGKRSLEAAGRMASSAAVPVKLLSRYGMNIASGIIHAQKEQDATDVVVGLHRRSNVIDSFLGNLTETLLSEIRREIQVVKMLMPLNTIRRIVVAVPPKAEYEPGFAKWVSHVLRMASVLGCRIHFHADKKTLLLIERLLRKNPVRDKSKLCLLDSWDDLLMLSTEVNYDHLLVIVSARRGSISYQNSFEKLPTQIGRYFSNSSLIVLYPDQFGEPSQLQAFADPMSGNVNPTTTLVMAQFRRYTSALRTAMMRLAVRFREWWTNK